MFPPFPSEQAHKENLALIQMLEKGQAHLKQLTKESEERAGQGLMLGSLVCKKDDKSFVLYALSGISRQLEIDSPKDGTIVVPPLADSLQIEKALFQNDKKIHQLTDKIKSLKKDGNNHAQISSLEKERTALTSQSLQKVFDLYTFTRFDGKKITLNEIITLHAGKLPPTGTGDCCAPKLLSYAFEHGLIPVSMDEVYFGKDSPNKSCGKSYPPCDERCGYILPSILGLEILYRDDSILLVNKQSGLLSVPGRTEDKKDCVEARAKKLFPFTMELNQPAVHRLDMETSGIMILAFTKEAHRELNRQFEAKEVHKKYIALLDGVLEKSTGLASPRHGEKSGRIELKFRLDPDNRPHQIYDEEFGKTGITLWQNLGLVNYISPDGSKKKASRILFMPETGRTHQLRLHSSDFHGFNLPIIGDSLYGNFQPGQRLMLHAAQIDFYHPLTREKMHFECPADF